MFVPLKQGFSTYFLFQFGVYHWHLKGHRRSSCKTQQVFEFRRTIDKLSHTTSWESLLWNKSYTSYFVIIKPKLVSSPFHSILRFVSFFLYERSVQVYVSFQCNLYTFNKLTLKRFIGVIKTKLFLFSFVTRSQYHQYFSVKYFCEYCQTCVQRPPLGPINSGRCWQVVAIQWVSLAQVWL